MGIGANDTVGYRGTFWSETNGSVGTLHYDFSPYGFQPDSIVIRVSLRRDPYSRDTVYLPTAPGDTGKVEAPTYFDLPSTVYRRDNAPVGHISDGKLIIKGSASFDIPMDIFKATGFDVLGYYQNEEDSTEIVWSWGYLWENASGLMATFVLPTIGYHKSKLAAPLDKEGIFGGLGFTAGHLGPRWSLMLSSTWSGFGNFSLSQPFRTEFKWFSRTHGNFIPELALGGGLSKIKVKQDNYEFRKVKWGVDFGAAIKVPFYRLSYRYATAAGGYHIADLYAQIFDDQRCGPGSHYTLQWHEKVWTVGVSYDFGLSSPNADNPTSYPKQIARRDKRPWPLRAFSYVAAIPFLPYLWIEEAFLKKD